MSTSTSLIVNLTADLEPPPLNSQLTKCEGLKVVASAAALSRRAGPGGGGGACSPVSASC